MARKSDHGAGATYEADRTAGEPLPNTTFGEGLDAEATRRLAAAGGAPGMRDAGAAPFGRGSTPADLPSGQTWAAPAGQG